MRIMLISVPRTFSFRKKLASRHIKVILNFDTISQTEHYFLAQGLANLQLYFQPISFNRYQHASANLIWLSKPNNIVGYFLNDYFSLFEIYNFATCFKYYGIFVYFFSLLKKNSKIASSLSAIDKPISVTIIVIMVNVDCTNMCFTLVNDILVEFASRFFFLY